ncbi:hypothetical protein PFICI_02398 [Pestalotiopsis fici W106-1]|uniref:Zn(2)-C6 fungal-type domain-containing protein n=1 Tax=Pestalotiopsis fici (strain W106-1 / CGMCC3.15140) TaxID=1229662 RepID=W3XE54_PESFW|nr:uncharacterized protein PFICI_02398 [Pestalotiopsis fici W106-1]ETS84373.1 hypothetical protein PFICI_02398 [Pestalotiopsis fici W106-1]
MCLIHWHRPQNVARVVDSIWDVEHVERERSKSLPQCDLGKPICWNCKRSRIYTCDGISGGSEHIVPNHSNKISQDATKLDHGRQTVNVPHSLNWEWMEQILGGSKDVFRSTSQDDSINETIVNAPISHGRGGGFSAHFSAATEETHESPNFMEGASFDDHAGQCISPSAEFRTLIETEEELAFSDDTVSGLGQRQHSSDDMLFSPPQQPEECLAGSATTESDRRSYSRKIQRLGLGDLLNGIHDRTGALLAHWKSHACHLMMPILAPTFNPWLRLYYPLAVTGPPSDAKSCLFHALSSAAGFHKATTARKDKTTLIGQAQERKTEASKRLRSIVHDLQLSKSLLADRMDRMALLAAAMTMATIEVFSGEHEGAGYEHLLLAKQTIRFTGGISWWTSNTKSITLLRIFKCLQIIGDTSGWTQFTEMSAQTESEDQPFASLSSQLFEDTGANCDLAENVQQHGASQISCEYPLDITFGVSSQTLQCISKIIDLSRVKENLSMDEQWLQSHVEQLKTLEHEVYSALNESSHFDGLNLIGSGNQHGVSDFICQEIKENHMAAFRYSTAIFFRRALCDGGSTIIPPRELRSGALSDASLSGQHLVDKALEHLENIDAISSGMTVANTLWVAFIAAVEAVDIPLRHRALIWFARARRHQIGNINVAKSLVMEVWRRVDRQTWARNEDTGGLGCIDWRNVMREKNMYFMLT